LEERARQPFASIEDFARRTKLHADELERLASIGAFAAFDRTRRDALWQVATLGRSGGPLFEAITFEEDQPSSSPLPTMSTLDRLRADILGTDLTIGPHPVARFREMLKKADVLRAGNSSPTPLSFESMGCCNRKKGSTCAP